MMAKEDQTSGVSLDLDGITDFLYCQRRTLPTADSIRLVRLTSISLLFGTKEVQNYVRSKRSRHNKCHPIWPSAILNMHHSRTTNL